LKRSTVGDHFVRAPKGNVTMKTNHTPPRLAAGLGVAALTAAATLGLGLATAGPAHAHGAGGGGGAGKAVVVHEQLIIQFTHSTGGGGGAGKVTAVDQFQRFVNRFAPPPPP
jgi:hypothetical protein